VLLPEDLGATGSLYILIGLKTMQIFH